MKQAILTPLVLLTLLGSGASAAVTTFPVSRPAAAQALTQAVRESRSASNTSEDALQVLVRAGEAVREELGDSRYATLLQDTILSARWRAVVDEEGARSWLVRELERAAQDLSFEPLVEASLPVGFPAPTPVQEIQLKRFPGYRMAFAPSSGAGGGFWTLFNHIKRNDIPMTAPVEMTYADGGQGLRQERMAFLYGSPEVGAVGTDGSVEVIDVESGWAVSIGCRGNSSREAIDAAKRLLESWIAERGDILEVAGELRTMGYNSPMVPAQRRYFEVQIPVRFAEGRVW